MTTENTYKILLQAFPFQPTAGQEAAAHVISRFIHSDVHRPLLVLKGYAGTGKTTLVSTLVRILPRIKLKSVLLAPTGRAAKVLSGYSGKPAYTVHKKIYRRREKSGQTLFELNQNLHTNSIFVVDEASMIATSSGLALSFSEYRDLLEDLIAYVYSGKNCRLIFVGDDAQLPPVGSDQSPALSIKMLRAKYLVNAGMIELTDVVRQSQDSGVLYNATELRDRIRTHEFSFPQFEVDGFPDVVRLSGPDLQDELESAYNDYGPEGTMIVCRSNKRANLFNQQVRVRIRWMEDELSAGDYLMVVRNNYFWLPEDSAAGFIANGEIVEVKKVVRYRELYGFRFAAVTARLIDYPNEPDLELKIMLDVINLESPSLGGAEMKKLYHTVAEDYLEEIPDRRKRHEAIMKNEFYQALQVKFAYAVTCHKAQGGQWPAVFVDQGFLTEEMIDLEFLRWLYTAMTRATEKLYLVNFDRQFYGGDED